MVRILLIALLAQCAQAQALRGVWNQFKGKPKSEITEHLISLGRDSILKMTIEEARVRYPDFDPGAFPYVRVKRGPQGVTVSFQMAIVYRQKEKPARYDLFVNLTHRSFGWTRFGEGDDIPAFQWDASARAAVRWVLNLDSTVRVDTLTFPSHGQITILDDGDLYRIEVTSSTFLESYRLNKRTRARSDSFHEYHSIRDDDEEILR